MSIYSPATRQELIDYCLRQLGDPVVEINVDPDQLEDRFEEALQYFREFHHDASERIYVAAKVTPSTLNLQSGNGNAFVVGDIITSGNASCIVHQLVSGNTISVKNVTGMFNDGATITGNISGTTGVLSSLGAVTLGSYDNKYFEIDEKVLSIVQVLQLAGSQSGINMFDMQYQFMLNSFPTLTNLDIGYYSQTMSYLSLLNDTLVGSKPIRYRRHTNRLIIDWNWKTDAVIGNYIVAEAFAVLDPEEFKNVYNDMWLKKYLTALIKKQWGINLKKFDGIQLPGGVTMNGQIIFNEAVEEIEQLKKECQDTFEEPVDFFVG